MPFMALHPTGRDFPWAGWPLTHVAAAARGGGFVRPDGRDGPKGGGVKSWIPGDDAGLQRVCRGSEPCEFKKNWRKVFKLPLCLNLRLRQRGCGRRCPDLPDSFVFQFGPLSSGDTGFLVQRQVHPTF